MLWEALPEEHQDQQHQQLSVLAYFVWEKLLGIFSFGAGLPQEYNGPFSGQGYIYSASVDGATERLPRECSSESSFTIFTKGV